MSTTENDVLDKLKARGHKMTHARRTIVHLLLRQDAPISASEVHAQLRKRKIEVSNVTVYRELAFLEAEGFLQGATFNDGVKRYCQAEEGRHHHLICTRCETIQDVKMDNDLDSIEKKIQKEKTFTVQSHMLEFYGICSHCTS